MRYTSGMTLTTPACPYGPELVANVKTVLLMLKGVKDVAVEHRVRSAVEYRENE